MPGTWGPDNTAVPDAIHIRAATPEDAHGAAAVHVAGWRAAYRGQFPDALLDGLDVDKRAKAWATWLEDPALDVHVAVGDRVVGFCMLRPSRDATDTEDVGASPAMEVGEIPAIYLHPDVWRTGLGSRLLDTSLAQARERGFREVHLWVLETNQRARSFYEARGFRFDGTSRPLEWIEGFRGHEVRYVRQVASG